VDSLLSRTLNPSDAVVITGFWRSGTTWLLQSLSRALDAKGVFEPFHYDLPGYADVVRQDGSSYSFQDEYLSAFMPFVRSHFSGSPGFEAYVRSALTGGITEPWVLGPRIEMRRHSGNAAKWELFDLLYKLKTALRTQIVTKFVRGHLLIPVLHQTFDPALIHIRRDPRSVVASFHRRSWSWHKRLSLKEQLLNPDDGRSTYFDSWADLIHRYDREQPLVRVAAYWALLERFVNDLPVHPRRATVSYEDLCLRPRETVRELASVLPATPDNSHFNLPSRTTEQERRKASIQERVFSWKNTLNRETVQKIERVVIDLGLSDALHEAKRAQDSKKG